MCAFGHSCHFPSVATPVAPLFLWCKSVPADRADTWCEKLQATVAPSRIVVSAAPGARNVRVEIYAEKLGEADGWLRRFGGRVREIPAEKWQPTSATNRGAPLKIGNRLWITGHEDELPALRAAHPGKSVLCVPAAMAFGTGEHATTAMCLRFLLETAQNRTAPWHLLDLGNGSGILALAGRLFGAKTARGLDNDPHAVRTARENAALNGVRGVKFQRADLVHDWQPESGQWPVITANLFSELLTVLLPRIRTALARDGLLIASGVLATQAAELEDNLRKNRLAIIRTRRRGKWTAFLICRKRAAT